VIEQQAVHDQGTPLHAFSAAYKAAAGMFSGSQVSLPRGGQDFQKSLFS